MSDDDQSRDDPAADADGVIDRTDGFFGVRGEPESVYYQDRATAERVARARRAAITVDETA